MELDANGAPTINAPANIIRIELRDPTDTIGSKNPRGVVINSTDTRAYVMNHISRDVTVVDISGTDPNTYKTLTRIVSTALPTPGTLAAQAFQIALFDDLVDSFNDAAITNLDNSGSPTGPGDLQFAFQHNFVIPSDSSASLTQIKELSAVPDPSTVALFLTGVALVLLQRRLRSKEFCL